MTTTNVSAYTFTPEHRAVDFIITIIHITIINNDDTCSHTRCGQFAVIPSGNSKLLSVAEFDNKYRIILIWNACSAEIRMNSEVRVCFFFILFVNGNEMHMHWIWSINVPVNCFMFCNFNAWQSDWLCRIHDKYNHSMHSKKNNGIRQHMTDFGFFFVLFCVVPVQNVCNSCQRCVRANISIQKIGRNNCYSS